MLLDLHIFILGWVASNITIHTPDLAGRPNRAPSPRKDNKPTAASLKPQAASPKPQSYNTVVQRPTSCTCTSVLRTVPTEQSLVPCSATS